MQKTKLNYLQKLPIHSVLLLELFKNDKFFQKILNEEFSIFSFSNFSGTTQDISKFQEDPSFVVF